MAKKIKLFSIILIIFSIIFSFYGVYATDIDMNIPGNADTNPNPEDANAIVDDTEVPPADTTTPEIPPTQDQSGVSIITPSSVDSIEEETLSFTNILNILLITVGVILILLAIAIIIRLK